MSNSHIKQLITKARDAQTIVNGYSQEQVDELILAVAWEVIKPENNQSLSELAVKTTGLGNVEDKKRKNKRNFCFLTFFTRIIYNLMKYFPLCLIIN